MEEIRHAFPNFVPNQVLTSGQLNALREYLDQQDRLSRVRLSGTGIVCGLDVDRLGSSGPIVVSEGFGISSDGYLIELPASRFTHYRVYSDPGNDKDGVPSYDAWKKRPALNQQIELLELLGSQEMPATDKALSAAKLDGRVVVLYLEFGEKDLRTCLVTDCNNNGSNYTLLPRVLLVKEGDLSSLKGCDPAPEPVPVPGLHSLTPLTTIKTTAALNDGYARIIETVLPDLLSAIEQSLALYGHVLPLGERPAEPRSFEQALRRAIKRGEVDQYHYDLVADVATAFNEFIVAACRWLSDCAAPADHARHLMLDHLDGKRRFRHGFLAAPVRGHWNSDRERVTGLLRRLLAMLDSVALGSADDLRITPSHDESKPLGERAIPHYFKFSEKQLKTWPPDDCCTPLPPWNYRGQPGARDGDYRRCGMLRIEGHVGSGWSDGRLELAKLRRQHNAEFDLLVLYLEGQGKLEREAFALLSKERDAWSKAEKDLIGVISDAAEAADFEPAAFKRNYADKAGVIREMEDRVKEREQAWVQVRTQLTPLCNLGHLEADYGAARAEMLCVLHRLSSALDTASYSYIPPIQGMEQAEREGAIRETAEVYKKLRARIETEGDAAKRMNLEAERLAAEAAKINLEAERTLLHSSRRSAPVVMAKTAWVRPEAVEKVADEVSENIKMIRGDNAQSMVQLSEQVTIEGLQLLLKRLVACLPVHLAAFDLDAFMAVFKQLAADLIELRLRTLVKLMITVSRRGMGQRGDAERAVLATLASSLELEEQELQHMILSVLHDCRNSRLIYIYHLYLHQRNNDNSRFADFASRHPGMEHLAGVVKGGTFILVAEDEDPNAPIVADFALRGSVSCCCETPDSLCLPPVAMPDYRIARLRLDKNGDAYLPVDLAIDVLENDYDPNADEGAGKGPLRSVELLTGSSDLGAKLQIDKRTGLVKYRLEGATAGAVDRFAYRLKVQSVGCSGEDIAQVMVLLVPEVKPQPQLGTIEGYVTWHKKGFPDAVIEVKGSDLRAKTDKNGFYRLDNLRAGSYGLQAMLWGGEVTSDLVTLALAAGETARVDFDLPADQQAMVGELVVNVSDGTTNEPIVNATVVLLDATNAPVARTNEMDAKGLYRLDGVPAGSYRLTASADGYYPYPGEAVSIKAAETTSRSIALAPRVLFIPGKAIEHVAVNDRLNDDVAREKVAEAYAGRQAGYMTAIANAGRETAVRNSRAFAKSEEFVSKTLQDPALGEEEIIRAYSEVSKDIAASVARAGEKNKGEYRVLLENVSKAFMDRVSLSDPQGINPKVKAALGEMSTTVATAGIDVKTMREAWKGDELGSGLNLKSTKAISALL